jgi:hypothetical protein
MRRSSERDGSRCASSPSLKPGPVWRFLSSIYLAIGPILSLAIGCVIGHSQLLEVEQVFLEAWWFSGLIQSPRSTTWPGSPA